MFKFFIEKELISWNQSGDSCDSCVNQLVFITDDIYKSSDDGHEVKGVFLDISKAFDKWYRDDILYDQAFNLSFQKKLESIHYGACLAITGAIWGTSREKIYQENHFNHNNGIEN